MEAEEIVLSSWVYWARELHSLVATSSLAARANLKRVKMRWDFCFSRCSARLGLSRWGAQVAQRIVCSGWAASSKLGVNCVECMYINGLGTRKQDVFTRKKMSYFWWSAPEHRVSFCRKNTLKVARSIFIMRPALSLFLNLWSTINLVSAASAFVKGEQIKMFCKLCDIFRKYRLYGTAPFCVIFYIQNIEGFRIEEEKLHIWV